MLLSNWFLSVQSFTDSCLCYLACLITCIVILWFRTLISLGARRPLLGDIMYNKISGFLVDKSGVVLDPDMVHVIEELPQLEGHIGLHAFCLEWRGHTFEAAAPWEML